MTDQINGHGGFQVLAAAAQYGIDTLFTLSGAHIFPLYDAAIGGVAGFESAAGDNASALRGGNIRVVDMRHEASAVFAAEAMAKLTRTPGFAAVTAGPGVTNAVSPMASAFFNAVPMLVVGGRSPEFRWGTGALQEFDHIPLVSPVTTYAATLKDPHSVASGTMAALAAAVSPRRGPAFIDVPMDRFYTPANVDYPQAPTAVANPLHGDVERIIELLNQSERPLLVLGSDVWLGSAEQAAADFINATGIPVIPNGMARGIVPRNHPQLVTRARGAAFADADLVVVVGTPLDFRLGYGIFGNPPVPVVHVMESADALSAHANPAATATGDLSDFFRTVAAGVTPSLGVTAWTAGLRERALAAIAKDAAMLESDVSPIHPGRIYGELLPRLTDDTVVMGDGGDFVSFAGRFVEPNVCGNWLDPGPFGCLGTAMGYAVAAGIARPDSPRVLLLGDGAAGFSLMDVDTLVRHQLPTVMVMGNNSAWGLEKHPMRLLHGYDVAADLAPATRYDEVVGALGGAGEIVTEAAQIGPALDRAFASNVPYLVNILTDAEIPYPRSTTGL